MRKLLQHPSSCWHRPRAIRRSCARCNRARCPSASPTGNQFSVRRANGRPPQTAAVRIAFARDVDLAELARLIEAEQECCTFFSFALTVDGRGLALEVGAPEAATEIVRRCVRDGVMSTRQTLGFAAARHGSADTACRHPRQRGGDRLARLGGSQVGEAHGQALRRDLEQRDRFGDAAQAVFAEGAEAHAVGPRRLAARLASRRRRRSGRRAPRRRCGPRCAPPCRCSSPC